MKGFARADGVVVAIMMALSMPIMIGRNTMRDTRIRHTGTITVKPKNVIAQSLANPLFRLKKIVSKKIYNRKRIKNYD